MFFLTLTVIAKPFPPSLSSDCEEIGYSRNRSSTQKVMLDQKLSIKEIAPFTKELNISSVAWKGEGSGIKTYIAKANNETHLVILQWDHTPIVTKVHYDNLDGNINYTDGEFTLSISMAEGSVVDATVYGPGLAIAGESKKLDTLIANPN